MKFSPPFEDEIAFKVVFPIKLVAGVFVLRLQASCLFAGYQLSCRPNCRFGFTRFLVMTAATNRHLLC
jgi:hypothetical protein